MKEVFGVAKPTYIRLGQGDLVALAMYHAYRWKGAFTAGDVEQHESETERVEGLISLLDAEHKAKFYEACNAPLAPEGVDKQFGAVN